MNLISSYKKLPEEKETTIYWKQTTAHYAVHSMYDQEPCEFFRDEENVRDLSQSSKGAEQLQTWSCPGTQWEFAKPRRPTSIILVKRLVLRACYFQDVCHLTTPEASGVAFGPKESLFKHQHWFKLLYDICYETQHPAPHPNVPYSVKVRVYCVPLGSRLYATYLGENTKLGRNSFPPWSLHSTGDVNYSLLCHKLPQNRVNSNSTCLLSQFLRVSWGPPTQGHKAQNVS